MNETSTMLDNGIDNAVYSKLIHQMPYQYMIKERISCFLFSIKMFAFRKPFR